MCYTNGQVKGGEGGGGGREALNVLILSETPSKCFKQNVSKHVHGSSSAYNLGFLSSLVTLRFILQLLGYIHIHYDLMIVFMGEIRKLKRYLN